MTSPVPAHGVESALPVARKGRILPVVFSVFPFFWSQSGWNPSLCRVSVDGVWLVLLFSCLVSPLLASPCRAFWPCEVPGMGVGPMGRAAGLLVFLPAFRAVVCPFLSNGRASPVGAGPRCVAVAARATVRVNRGNPLWGHPSFEADTRPGAPFGGRRKPARPCHYLPMR